MTIEAGPDELFTTRAKAADVAAIVELVNSAYRGDSSRRGWTTEADLIDGTRIDASVLEQILALPDSAVLVLRAQSGLLGCVEVSKKDADAAYVGMLSIRPALQSSGLGRQMLAAAETFARHEFGARFAEMTVIEERLELIAWYERRGYRDTGERRPYPYNDERLGIPKSPQLRMIVMRKTLAI
ncbi:MAG: N-acetyltransferase [Proteobacteria bacterium]|nr:N-acetyltransferase [Pseudomonadota bacterium]